MSNEELIQLETSLRNYFFDSVDVKKGESTYASRMRYRSVTIRIDNHEHDEPCFKVGIGAFEATFRISDGIKIHGSLTGDEKTVMKWFHKGSNREFLQSLSNKSLRGEIQTAAKDFVKTNFHTNSKNN